MKIIIDPELKALIPPRHKMTESIGRWWCNRARQGFGARVDRYEHGLVTVRVSGPGMPTGIDNTMSDSDFLKNYIFIQY